MKNMGPNKLNSFLALQLPSAWICGVRVKKIEKDSCVVGVRHKWINQNPFRSMYFAVQAMAAELSTGAMIMAKIQQQKEKISMLVAQNNSQFTKKATGKILFTCNEGQKIEKALEDTISSGDGKTFWMQSIGKNEAGEQVAIFNFEWTIKLKNK